MANHEDVPGTAERLMDEAERLFGEKGYALTTLRDITAAAEANVAAVNYHFGSKEGLLRATVDRRMDPLNEERVRVLEEAEAAAAPDGPALETIIRTFIAPTVRMCFTHPEFMRFMSRMHTDPDSLHWEMVRRGRFKALIEVLRRTLIRALPDVPTGEIWWRMMYVVGAVIHAWSDWDKIEMLSAGEARFDGEARLIESLVEFCCAGLRAPVAGGVA